MKKRVLSLFLAITLCLTLTPTGALAAEGQPPEQMVTATQEAQIPAPALEEKEEEKTTPAQTGAGENASPASPDEKPTENTPAAPEKNPADEEPGKEAGQNEPTAEGKNEPLALGLDDPGQNAAEGENGEGSGGTHYVAESGGTHYETVQKILDEMEEGEITLLDSVTENLTVDAATTIHMNGHSITGNIDATDSLTLNGGTVNGTVQVDGGTFTMTAPAEAEAAITGGLKVVSGSAFVSGAQVGVKGTLYFGGTDMLISGAVKAVELNSAAEPAANTLYGSATVNGDTAAEAGFDTDTYKVGGKIAKKLTNKQVGSTTPAAPSLTLTETSKSLTAGKTAVFTAHYTGTDTLNAYVQGSAVNGYFTISQKNNDDGTYTVSVKIDEETPGGTYTLFVHELEDTSVQASATITVTGLPDAAEVNGKQYKSLPRALAAAQDGDTVKLLADHVTDADALKALGENFTFEQYASIVPVVTKTLTLDLNHKTVDYLEVGFTETNEETQKKETLETGNLTVTGEGAYGRILNLMFMAGALNIRSGEIGGSGCAGLVCDVNSGTATISNGMVYGLTVLEGASVTVNGGSNHAGAWVVASGATLNITEGKFGDVQFTRNGTIAISGGTFQSIKGYIAEELQPLMSLLDTQKVHAFYKDDDVQDGNATELFDVTVKEHTHTMVNNKCACGFSCTHTNTEGASTIDKDGKCTACGTQFAAGIGETYYTDVPSALDAATDGQTVKLLANAMLPDGIYVSKTLTLDLNGHSLSGYSLNVGGLTPTGQVRTGNLTVIDSSGGNGAVGVTVRDGGTLVFDPKNDHTTLLRLEVWGGTVDLYGGKILRSGLQLNNNITLGDLLPQKAGLAYYRDNTQLTLEEAASQTCDLVVKSCSHGGKNGFDKSATACPYCGAPAVAETALKNGEGNRLQRRFADLQTALDADRDGGSTLKLLADVTGDYTIDGTKDTGIDLNGYSINGTVDVKAVAEGTNNTTTFSNSKDTGSIKTVVAHRGANLAGSGAPAVIGTLEIADTTMWKNLLKEPDRVGFKVRNEDSTHKWYAASECKEAALYNVTIESLPITFKTLYLKVNGKNLTGNSPKVERGTTVQLCASCNAKGADVSIYIGETVGNSLPIYRQKKAEYKKIGSTWYYVVDLDANKIGTYDIYFTASKDGYKVTSNHKKLTVTKPNLSNAEITFRNNSNESTYEPYNATTTAPGFTVTYNGKTLKLGVDYTASGTASSAGVSTQRLTIKAVEGSDYTGSKTAEWKIVPHKAKVEVGDVIKAYDGTTDLPDGKISLVSAAGSAGHQAGRPLPLSEGSGFELTDAKYDSANASETEKNISFTVKLTDTNYTFEDGTKEKAFTLNGAELNDKTFKINKAAIASDTQLYQTVFNDLAKTYEIDLNQVLNKILPKGGTYGDIQYGTPSVSMYSDYYPVGGATIGDGKLSLSINKAASIKQGDEIGTVAVEVETTNYQPFTLTIHVSAQDKLVPVPAEGNAVSATDITYGKTLADSELTVKGTMQDRNTGATVKGTFAWTDGTIKPDAGSYDAEWTFTPAEGYEEYATATGTVTIKVKPAKLIVSVKASSMYYTGKEQIASIIASGESVDSTPVTFTYSDKKDGNYTSGGPTFTDAGTYTVYYKAEAANHEPATGTFTVTIAPLPISLRSVSSISKTYDGSADVTLTADKLTFFSNTTKAMNIKLPNTALTFSNAQFTKKQADRSYLPSPEVGGGKALSFTMTLTSSNYVFEGKSEGTTEVSDVFATDDANRFTITKATAPTGIQTGTLNVINGTTLEYTYDAKQILPAAPNGTYGTVLYSGEPSSNFESGYTVNSFKVGINSGVLTLTIDAQNGGKTGKIGSVTIYVTTDNYEIFNLPLDLYAVNQIKPVPDGKITASEITYGNELSASTITGTMEDPNTSAPVDGTFAWKDGTITPAANDRYEAEWTFTPDAPEYATVTGTVTVKVNKADIPTKAITAPTAQENLTYTGQEQPLIIAGSVTDHGTMQYSLTENGKYSQNIPTGTDAGTYTVWYRVFGDANHNDTAPASVTVRIGKKPLPPPRGTAASKTYDGTTNAGITSVTFDNVTLNRGTDYTVTASFDDAGVGNDKNVTATVTLMGQAAKNYALEQSSFLTTGSITAKQVTVSGITANGKVYDGTTDAVLDYSKVVLDGVLENDTLTVTAKGMFEKADVGEQKVTISDLTLDGNSANNYVLAESGNQTETIATITAKEVTVTPDNKSKVYQEKDPELTYIVSGVLSGETLKGITLARAEGENAGQYAITATADAGANPNYEVTFAKGTLTIEPKSIKGAKVVLGKGLTANGAEQTQTVEKVLLDDKEIPADSYTVAGNTATAPGRYTLTVTAKGNYTDSVEQIYAIAYKDTAVPSSSKPSSNNSSNDSETKKNEVAAPTPASTSKPSTITAMPQTGDTSNPTLYVVLLVASLLGLAVVFVCKKRNDK